MEKKNLYELAFKICPPVALMFSILVTVTTLYINEGISPLFIFISIQVYLNWYAIYTISQNATTAKRATRDVDSNDTVAITINAGESPAKLKYWYCEKCMSYTIKPTQHCVACNKCFHYRDHHCFFIGGCVTRENMGNFVLICFHTSLACIYSLTVIGPYLYESLRDIFEEDPSLVNVIINFCFPIALTRLLVTGKTSCLLLITLFDTLFSVWLVSFIYGFWKLWYCISGRQRYYPHAMREFKLQEIFGSYGLLNVLFPYNGLICSEEIGGKCQLKNI
ncbi:palmitoyltransferase ZDHHC22-like [Microplitis mediator]|uniref:palmitoyltransferase ZDHHC22-like n=1 Tax=Microplitis mediator TaxID=375433 RepID=UPI0025550541|nr:palmitoyltransferase ZDHHC22-like [Microplitis mediator]XP_057331749.1 palmitoyltransferase ZDHHC22-like [Microplitis mediator]